MGMVFLNQFFQLRKQDIMDGVKIRLEHILSIFLVVIVIGVTLYYGLDPQVAIRERRNEQRKRNITNILNAIHMYKTQSGSFPPDIAGK